MAKAAIDRIDPRLHHLILEESKGVFIIANNPDLDRERLAIFGASNNILIQFNRSPFFDLFQDAECKKIHIFNANDKGSFWGFDPEGLPDKPYAEQKHDGPIALIFIRWMSEAVKHYVDCHRPTVEGAIVDIQFMVPDYAYPEGKLPSAGYSAVSLFRFANEIRESLGIPRLSINLLGFTGRYPTNQGWAGHDFNFEQKQYMEWDSEINRLMET